MSDLVSIITPTGSRPDAFALCCKYMRAQTYTGSVQWIVVNDVPDQVNLIHRMSVNWEVTPISGPIVWQEGLNTQKVNLTEALKHVKGKYLFFIEDDDWYNPKFIETMVWMLDRFVLVGESNSKYYNVQVPGWKQMSNFRHASLSSTGMRIEALPHLQAAIAEQGLYIDIAMWGNVRRAGLPTLLFSDKQLSVGIKGMPGRAGIGVGHTKTKDYLIDPVGAKLAEWIGADAVHYRPYLSTKFVKKETPNAQEVKKAPRVQSSSEENRIPGVLERRSGSNLGAKNAQSIAQSQAQKPFATKSQR